MEERRKSNRFRHLVVRVLHMSLQHPLIGIPWREDFFSPSGFIKKNLPVSCIIMLFGVIKIFGNNVVGINYNPRGFDFFNVLK